ncbi:MAG: hypothetical protein IT293_19030 [Deltaproteobacteria bacterium]|nr:hypothetical protein [Deltaproteobacteria bacterium]
MGGVLGVVMKSTFAAVAGATAVNAAVALVVGAPHSAHLFSIAWTVLGNGRDKIRFLVSVQVLSMASLFLVALASARGRRSWIAPARSASS